MLYLAEIKYISVTVMRTSVPLGRAPAHHTIALQTEYIASDVRRLLFNYETC